MILTWSEFYSRYNDQKYDLSSRLSITRKYINDINSDAKPLNILSICGGRGLDIIDLLKNEQSLVIIDNDVEAENYVNSQKLKNVKFLLKNAEFSTTYNEIPRCDLLICVGFMGSITKESIENFISFLPQIINKNAMVVWTVKTKNAPYIANIKGLFEKYNFETLDSQKTKFNKFTCFKSKFVGNIKNLNTNEHIMQIKW